MADGSAWMNVAILASLVIPFILGIVARSGRRWIALAGVAVALVAWAAVALAGAFEDDTEGTAAVLSLIYGVSSYAVLWAAAVGAGFLAQSLWR